MPVVPKTPNSIDTYFVDFAAQLSEGESIVEIAVRATDSTTSRDVSATFLGPQRSGISGSRVTFWYRGGEVGHGYHVSVLATTSSERQLEGTVNFLVVRELN